MSEMIDRVARTFLADLQRQTDTQEDHGAAYIGGGEPLTEQTIDGRFDLLAAFRAAIAAMREPAEAMIEAGIATVYLEATTLSRSEALAVWSAMIDAALKE